MYDLAISLENFCHHGGTNINAWAEVSSEDKAVFGKWDNLVPILHPLIPFMFCKW